VNKLVDARDRRRLRWMAEEADDPVLRFRALRCLAEILDPNSAGLFLSHLCESPGELPTPIVRSAAEGIGRLLYRDGAPALRRLLRPNRPAAVQLAAARALANLDTDEEWEAIRTWARRADGKSHLIPSPSDDVEASRSDPQGTAPTMWVLEALYADKNPTWWNRKATHWLKNTDSRPRLSSEKGADRIVAQEHRYALENHEVDDETFRRRALHLGMLARDRDFPFLVAMLEKEANPDRRRSLASSIGLTADPRGIPLLEAWLSEVPLDEEQIAVDIALAAGRLAWPQLSGPLASFRSRHPSTRVRQTVAWALGECGGEQAVRALLESVRKPDGPLPEEEFTWTCQALLRCGNRGREAIRGGLTIARAGGGERDRLQRLAEATGLR